MTLRYKNVNIMLFSLVGILEAVQILLVASYISYFIPISVDPNIFIPEKPAGPTRAILLYRIFGVATIAIFAGSVFAKRRQLDSQNLSVSLGRFLVGEAILTAFIFYAYFKLVIAGEIPLASHLFYAFLGLAVLFKGVWMARRQIG